MKKASKKTTKYQPRDPNFREKVKDSFARQKVMGELGVELTNLSPGKIEFQFPYNERWTQQHGFIHAGIISTVMDSACGYAAFSLMPKDAAVLSVEFKSNFLAPAAGEQFRIVSLVIRSGRTITVAEADAFAISSDKEKHVAHMTATIMTVLDNNSIKQ